MGFFSSLRGEFIDIIEWTDDSNNTLVYRFERHDNEIKNEAKLTVREGQVAVFINEGKIADVFEPGMYTLNTQNLPLLSTLKGWKYGFDSPFKAEVYFINMRNFTDQKWGTKNPITLSDPRFGMLEIRAFGTYVMKVKEPTLFIREIVGTDGHFTTDEITNQLRSLIVTRFTDAIGEADLPVEKYAANTNEIAQLIKGIMQEDFDIYGIDLTNFLIENISMPDEIKTEIFELSRLNSIDLDKFAKIKAAKAMEKAAENESGTAGAGMGMGMGFAMANQMGNAFQGNTSTAANNPSGPPPIPQQAAFHVVLNGQQAGPYDMASLQQMIAQNQLTRESLVWKQGMTAWAAASQVSELANLFGSVPPPLPPQ
jgi:membrane protease subunit (stomatin/prohibitin family)